MSSSSSSSHSSSYSSSSSSTSDSESKSSSTSTTLKRYLANLDSGEDSESTSGSGSSSEMNSGSESESDFGTESESESESEKDSKPKSRNVDGAKKRAKNTEEPVKVDGGGEDGQENEVKVLSHKEQRRLKKKQLKAEAAAHSTESLPKDSSESSKKAKQVKQKASRSKDANEPRRRENSVWVGNLSYRTTSEALRAFFEEGGAKEVTRVHMPSKSLAPGAGTERMKWVKTVKENRGFAYVDFSTPEAKALAITFSERNLDGRRLLIKDGDDFTGRPALSTENTTSDNGVEAQNTNPPHPHPDEAPAEPTTSTKESTTTSTSEKEKPKSGFPLGPTKTAKKILGAQKQPPCPCLFVGNLGFEATETKIKEMIEGHARAIELGRAKRKKEKELKKLKEKEAKMKMKMKKKKEKKGKDAEDGEGGEKETEVDGMDVDVDVDEENLDVEVDVGIKKVRLGTFEDSGNCKGFAFVDFTSIANATAALTNPANHFLDGRALVVEYASPDAARRGGYRPGGGAKGPTGAGGKARERERKGRIPPKRSGPDKYNDKRKKKRKAGEDIELGNEETKSPDEAPPKSKRPRIDTDENSYSEISKRGKKNDSGVTGKGGRKEKRQKPGAALAQAQREKYAIVPSEGTRLKFS